MTLRTKFAFWFAALVSAVLFLSFLFIYYQSADFRHDDFYLRLKQKALTTHRFLIEVNEIDTNLLKIIDRNTMSVMEREQVMIFDDENRLLYTSIDSPPPRIDPAFIERVRREREVEEILSDGSERLGLSVQSGSHTSVVLASAYDLYGLRKLNNLLHTLVVAWFLGLGISMFFAYIYVRNIVGKPLTRLTHQVAKIGESDLSARLDVPLKQDELTVLATGFNELLERLERSLSAQRSFVQFASHELRTPLANMLSETENTLSMDRTLETYRLTLVSLREEQGKLINLTNALLLLSNQEGANRPVDLTVSRLDEVLYQTIEELRAHQPSFRIAVDFETVPDDEEALLLPSHPALLRLALRNLLENACRYSPNQTAAVRILPGKKDLAIHIENEGEVLGEKEAELLFTPFFRGANAVGRRGFGLGLVIAQRILAVHRMTLAYQNPSPGLNRFVVKYER